MARKNSPNKDRDHPAQMMMSRTGSFPLRVAVDQLRKLQGRSSCKVVLDPFCGKGTTLLAARLLGTEAYGIDVGPEAVASSKAKMADVTLDQVVRYVRGIRLGHPKTKDVPKDVKRFFHEETLTQILSIRRRLQRDLDGAADAEARFTTGLLLGILHGHANYSLSVSSSHAFSMSPRYVTTYAKQHGLRKPVRDVRNCLEMKALQCLSRPLPAPVQSEVKLGQADDATQLFPNLVGEVDLILTSPPYLNAQTYAKDNWLRLWFLGYDFRDIRSRAIETGSVETYSHRMNSVIDEFYRMLRPGGLLACIAGDAGKRKGVAALFDWE